MHQRTIVIDLIFDFDWRYLLNQSTVENSRHLSPIIGRFRDSDKILQTYLLAEVLSTTIIEKGILVSKLSLKVILVSRTPEYDFFYGLIF